jgi:hypothetical protein
MSTNLLLGVAYFFLGIISGYISGIAETEIAIVLITSFLAFFGSKLLFDISKKPDIQIRRISIVLIVFSIAFFLSLNVGIYVKVHRIFTPERYRDTVLKADSKSVSPYLRNYQIVIDPNTAKK